MVKMIDISKKPIIMRIAKAKGELILQKATLQKIKEGQIKKGDPFIVAGIAATTAVKKTPELIPLCHQIPISDVKTEFKISKDDLVGISLQGGKDDSNKNDCQGIQESV